MNYLIFTHSRIKFKDFRVDYVVFLQFKKIISTEWKTYCCDSNFKLHWSRNAVLIWHSSRTSGGQMKPMFTSMETAIVKT